MIINQTPLCLHVPVCVADRLLETVQIITVGRFDISPRSGDISRLARER